MSSIRCQASGALTPASGRKFHCSCAQPPATPALPGSGGTNALTRAIGFGAAVATSGRARSSRRVSATLWPSRIVSTRVRGANTRGPPTPVVRCTAARAERPAERS
jgi:hypothetical protein